MNTDEIVIMCQTFISKTTKCIWMESDKYFGREGGQVNLIYWSSITLLHIMLKWSFTNVILYKMLLHDQLILQFTIYIPNIFENDEYLMK